MPQRKVQLYHVHDARVTSKGTHENPFRVKLTATFRDEYGRQIRNLPGFYDGASTWKIRFCPTEEGTWRGVTRSDEPSLDGLELGPIVCVPNRNPNVHGLLTVDMNHRHRFIWSDGTPFVPLGFELNWLAAFHQRLGQPKGKPVNRKIDRFTPALDLLVKRGFNYLTANVYAHSRFADPKHPYVLTPPDLYPFGGSNDRPDHRVLNVKFFKDLDKAIAATHARGIAVDLMLQVQNKGVKWPERFSWEDDNFWRYVVARYQAYGNVIWDVSKETYYLQRYAPAHGYTLSRMQLIRSQDAYRHLLTAHDVESHSQGRNHPIDDICDYVSDQVHLYGEHDREAVVEAAWRYNREAIRRVRMMDKPYINIEFGYEKGVENIKTIKNRGCRRWQDLLIWTYALYAGGAHANYYYNNTAWNLVKFRPEPESWKRYGHLRKFLDMMDLAPMVPDNEFAWRGMCLAECGRQYFVFLPEGGDETLDLAAVPAGKRVQLTWMDIFTGKTARASIKGHGFRKSLKNPLPKRAAPCAVYAKVAE